MMQQRLPSKLALLLSRLRERGEVRWSRGEWHASCPAHEDRNPSLGVQLSPDRSCTLLHCAAGCKAEEIVQPLDLELCHLFHDDDVEILLDDQFRATADVAEPPDDLGVRVDAGPPSPLAAPAGPPVAHEVYSALLSLLSLSDAHRANLHERGLDAAAIERFEYRSADAFAIRQALGQLKQRFSDDTLLGVPGFRLKAGRVVFVDLQGLLIPVRDLEGRIVALKIRCDDLRAGAKYIWISSPAAGGPSPGSPVHVPLGTPATAAEARLTEGELKADIASVLTGLPTIGIPGVTNWRPAIETLRTMGVQAVRLAFDQDQPPKPGVVRELRACAESLIQQGFEVQLETWDNADGQRKGIDDLVAAGGEPTLTSGQAVLAAINQSAAQAADGEDDWFPTDPSEIVEPFPLECFPVALRRFADETAAALQCPVDLVGVPLPPAEPIKPSMTTLYIQDVTTEALAALLEANPRGLLMIRDELLGWVRAMNQYRGGLGADRQFYLSTWSGSPHRPTPRPGRLHAAAEHSLPGSSGRWGEAGPLAADLRGVPSGRVRA